MKWWGLFEVIPRGVGWSRNNPAWGTYFVDHSPRRVGVCLRYPGRGWVHTVAGGGGGCFDIIHSDPGNRLIRGRSGLLIRPGPALKRGGRYFGDRDSELCPRYARGSGGGK